MKRIVPQTCPLKHCHRCQQDKPVTDFRRQRTSVDGYQSICKKCCGLHLRWNRTPIQRPLFVLSKVCSRCGVEQSIDQFPPNKASKDGYYSLCYTCKNVQGLSYVSAHYEERQAYQRQYDSSTERIRARQIRYDEKCRQDPEAVAQGWEVFREWQLAHPFSTRGRDGRRAAREKNADVVERVDYEAILERDGWFCYICEKPIDPTLRGKDPASLSFDHEKPLAGQGDRKGTHTADNIHPAHWICNNRKKTRLLHEMTPYQRRGP